MRENQQLSPTFLSAPTAANLCGVTRNTVCTWIRQGKIETYQTPGGRYLIRPYDLIAFMKRHGMFVPKPLRDLARREEESDQDGPISGQPAGPEPEPAILVVDDFADARNLAVRCLRKLQMPVLEAESGYEALHLLLKHPEVSLVVLDVMMPGQLGSETLVDIRKHHLHMPVLIVTGYAHDLALDMLRACPPDDILAKPYQPADLIDKARALLAV